MPDNFDLIDFEECSPMFTKNIQTTRFPWSNKPTIAVIMEEEKWIPPSKNTMIEAIFNKVKEHLKWTGDDKLMKTSDEMKKLLDSGRTLNVTRTWTTQDKVTKNKVTKTETFAVKFSDGRIIYKMGNSICIYFNCWKSINRDGYCNEHSAGHITHFLINDATNPRPTFALMSSIVHSPSPRTPPSISQMFTGSANHWKSERAYDAQRTEEGHPPKWVIIKKWVARDLEQSEKFEQTSRVFLSVLFFFWNSKEEDTSKKFVLIRDTIWSEKANLSVVKQMLQSCGVELELGGLSEYANDSESPLLKIQDLKRNIGDRWCYAKFGCIGRLYVGKLVQHTEGPIQTSYIHPHHLVKDPDVKGIPLFQSQQQENELNKIETDMMEGLGQIAVIVCEMLEGKVDQTPIKADFKKIEHFSDWQPFHLERMEKLVEFFSGQKLELKVPKSVDISLVNWQPVKMFAQ